MRLAVCLLLIAPTACGPELHQARRSRDEPPSARELEALQRVRASRCRPVAALAFPGVNELCEGRALEGAALMGAGAAELATGIAVAAKNGIEFPGAGAPLIAVQDLWLYGSFNAVLERQRAARWLYVPQDSLEELMVAPFNGRVLLQPDVLGGVLVAVGGAVALSSVLSGPIQPNTPFGRPNLFGQTYPVAGGDALAAAIGVAFFEQVAIAEETTFRGYFQSQLARTWGETAGWLGASLLFGATHSLNALFMPPAQREPYLLGAVPYITLTGAFLGLSYRWHGYSLAPPVAIHFWYDFLQSAIFFLLDPQHSPLSASLGGTF